jgi:hypothetical protein
LKRKWIISTLFVCEIVFSALIQFPHQARAESPGVLEGLRLVKIVVENLGKDAEGEQITERMLEDQVLVTIRSKAPMLRYDPGVGPYLYVNLTLIITETSYAGFLHLDLVRPVDILVGVHRASDVPSKRIPDLATVWTTGTAFRGRRGGAAAQVRQILERQLEEFLADYFRGNQ